ELGEKRRNGTKRQGDRGPESVTRPGSHFIHDRTCASGAAITASGARAIGRQTKWLRFTPRSHFANTRHRVLEPNAPHTGSANDVTAILIEGCAWPHAATQWRTTSTRSEPGTLRSIANKASRR